MTALGGPLPQAQVDGPASRRGPGRARLFVVGAVALLLAAVVGWWLAVGRHPTAFSDFGYGAGITRPVGTTVAFPLTPNTWEQDHGTLGVRAITPRSVVDATHAATFTIWRCARSRVGAPGGPVMGVGPVGRYCHGAREVSGSFAYDASRGSRDALLLAVTSTSPGTVSFDGVDVDYREGLRSGHEVIGISGRLTFTGAE